MSARREAMINELRNKEYREEYAEQHVNSFLATQISVVREQRGMTQAELALIIGKQQPAISRIENVNYAKWNVGTLREVARALDCWVEIRLASWGELVEDAQNITTDTLRVPLLDDDPVFFGSDALQDVSQPVRWVQKQLLPWLRTNTEPDKLAMWLQGVDMPPVGDIDPPYVWITRAVEVEPNSSIYRELLAKQALALLNILREDSSRLESGGMLLNGLYNLLASFPIREGWQTLKEIYEARRRPTIVPDGAAEAAFINALAHNQQDESFEKEWLSLIRPGHAWLKANEFDALAGIKLMKSGSFPPIRAIAKALGTLSTLKQNSGATSSELRRYFSDILFELRDSFPQDSDFPMLLWEVAQYHRAEWQSSLTYAWEDAFPEERQRRDRNNQDPDKVVYKRQSSSRGEPIAAGASSKTDLMHAHDS